MAEKPFFRQLLQASSIGINLVLSTFVGLAIGYGLDSLFHTSPWLTIIFLNFGLFTSRNTTVMAVLFVCALVAASALFLILELDQPFGGLIKISSAPLLNALAHLGVVP